MDERSRMNRDIQEMIARVKEMNEEAIREQMIREMLRFSEELQRIGADQLTLGDIEEMLSEDKKEVLEQSELDKVAQYLEENPSVLAESQMGEGQLVMNQLNARLQENYARARKGASAARGTGKSERREGKFRGR